MHATQRSLVMLVALVFTATLAFAQAPQDRPAGPPPGAPGAGAAAQAGASASGELSDVDAKEMTITVKTATADMKFKYDNSTKVTGSQKAVAGLATAKGSQVTVQYKKDGADNIATSIDVKGAAGGPGGPAPERK